MADALFQSMSLDWLPSELARWEAEGLKRRRRSVTPLGDGWVEVDGRRMLNLAGNDYLCLAEHSLVREAAITAIEQSGVGSRASALVSGRGPWHERLEQRLAQFEGEEAAILFPTGYAANIGTICALVGAEDTVFCDRLNHASLIDGCRLSGAKFRLYKHGDLDGLAGDLAAAMDRRRRLIVSDAIFSMDGDVAPLEDLHNLARQTDSMLLVDEAHATGVLGEHGRGLAEHFRLPVGSAIRVGTLSKAIGSIGGFVIGSQQLIDWLWNTARPQVFSTALPPACAAAAAAAVDVIAREPERRRHLADVSREFRPRLVESGLNVPPTAIPTPIIPVIVGDEGRTMAAAAQLEERGFLVGAIRPPSVPRGTSRLRISLNSSVTSADLDRLIPAIVDSLRMR